MTTPVSIVFPKKKTLLIESLCVQKECGKEGRPRSVSKRRRRLRSRCVRRHSVKMLSQVPNGSASPGLLASYWSTLVCNNSQAAFMLNRQNVLSCNISPSAQRAKEESDPDNRNEHMPAVGSDQLALTSAPDWTAE